ncbi:MAG: hypothetical protein OXN96_03875 [Bryobacterales bacterium]|nr:hypothetical protein [Bryobacterales bacterium]
MDGTVRFNTAFYPGDAGSVRETKSASNASAQRLTAGGRQVFISHKTDDSQAEEVARYITTQHGIITYLAEWDPNVRHDSLALPDYIMREIQISDGFLVNVRPQIAISMWVGYEIGGAHAHEVPSAKMMFSHVTGMPSVVEALKSLKDYPDLDDWIRRHVLRVRHG